MYFNSSNSTQNEESKVLTDVRNSNKKNVSDVTNETPPPLELP
jgi:hypothetical protein